MKLVTLEGGLDPDRFVREHGIQAYGAAPTHGAGVNDALAADLAGGFEDIAGAFDIDCIHRRIVAHP